GCSMTIKKRWITATPSDRSSMRGEMRGGVSSSGTPSIAPNQTSGRALPTFTRPNPLFSAPPPLLVSPALIPSNSTTISRTPQEKKSEGSEMKFIRPPPRPRPQIPPQQVVPLSSRPTESSPPIENCIAANGTKNHENIEEQESKEPQERQPIKNEYAKDELVSFLDEERKMSLYCRETISTKGISAEEIKKTLEELDGDEKERRSEISSQSKLLSLRQRRVNEEEEYLRTEQCNVADICEVLLKEKSPFTEGFVGSFKKDLATGTLMDMMTSGALEPVKVSDWADKVDYDEYYLGSHARRVCKKFPQGIVKIKPGINMVTSTFVMDDALSVYVQLCKAAYSNELLAILSVQEGVYEKDIYSTLGMNMLDHLPTGDSSAFVVQQRPEGRYITMRVIRD
ncbi:hypothetical protein PMAYCL1PPCAC_24737, partial [Pristionchus mayeri]